MLASMPLPPLAEEVLSLLDRPDVTPTQRMILKLAAGLITQDLMEFDQFNKLDDPRLRMSGEEIDMLPDRFEVWKGKPIPKHWDTPANRAAVEKERAEIAAFEAQGMTYEQAVNAMIEHTREE
jgi:hypothetical protein